jgi:hypothetical protein
MKKIICAMLLLSVLCSFFLGCNSDSAKPDDAEGKQAESENGDTGDEGPVVYTPDLPEKDYGGYEFKVYQRGPNVNASDRDWIERCIYAEAENGDRINDAVYRRNMVIEARYNIKIVPIDGSGGIYNDQIKKDFEKSVLAGDQLFDMAMSGVYDSSLLATQGYLINLYEMPYIDLEKPWWDVPVNETLKIQNKLYFGMSCMGISDKDDSFCILFNKEVARDTGIENPYQLVRDNKWTFDTFMAIARTAAADLNGDGVMGPEDRYGYSGFDAEAWNLFIASGERIARIDNAGVPYFTMINERSVQVYDAIYTIFTEENFMLKTSGILDLHEETYRLLVQNQVLFAGSAMTVVQKARAMEQDFGMLPYPKFDAAQDKHYTICGLWGPTAVTVPVTNQELERTGIIIEAMVAEGMNTIFPAYYDINLVTKGLRDEDSKEMLDIIMAGRSYDIGMLYDWGGIRGVILESIQGKNASFMSVYEKREGAALKAMQKTIDEFTKISDR